MECEKSKTRKRHRGLEEREDSGKQKASQVSTGIPSRLLENIKIHPMLYRDWSYIASRCIWVHVQFALAYRQNGLPHVIHWNKGISSRVP